jgi:hypothetical protein
MTKPNQHGNGSARSAAKVWLTAGGFCAVIAFAACMGNVGSPTQGPGNQNQPGGSGSATGGTGSSGGSAATSGTGGSSSGGGASCAQAASFAGARLTVITDDQYRNIVHDSFGVTIPATFVITQPPSDTGSYTYNEAAQVDQATIVQTYKSAADEVASLLTTPLPGCATSTVDATCMQQFLTSQLPLAWRRPVTSDETSGLMTIFNSAAVDGQARQIQLVIEAVLLHPAFLYRSEIGTNAANMASGKVALTPYELASAVSFGMLNSVPDPELWSKAQDGSITTPSVLASEVTRLMAVPAAHAFLTNLVSSYLDFEYLPFVGKDPTAYPQWQTLEPILYQSSQAFLNDLMWNGGQFNDLFTSRKVYTNEVMSAAYGLPSVTGTQLQAVTTTGDMYNAGLLTQPALLAASNKAAGSVTTPGAGDDVIHRGLWIYYNLVCAPALPLPPPNALAVAATLTGDPTRYQAEYRDGPIAEGDGGVVLGSGCGVGCHSRFDPFGLPTMSYDGIGRYRTTDPSTIPPNGPVDDSSNIPMGVLTGVSSNITVNGVPYVHVNNVSDLAQLFLKGRQASDCAADILATDTLEHSPDVENSCQLQAVKDSFQKSGSFTDLFASIINSPAFLTRDIENP